MHSVFYLPVIIVVYVTLGIDQINFLIFDGLRF